MMVVDNWIWKEKSKKIKVKGPSVYYYHDHWALINHSIISFYFGFVFIIYTHTHRKQQQGSFKPMKIKKKTDGKPKPKLNWNEMFFFEEWNEKKTFKWNGFFFSFRPTIYTIILHIYDVMITYGEHIVKYLRKNVMFISS